ncbi:MAG TPA: SpoIIE family protein phosphatase [Thermoanaerobaculia bacterium]
MQAPGTQAYAELLHSIVDLLPEGVVIAGTSTALLFCNAAARRIGGFDSDVAAAAWATGAGSYLPDETTPYPRQEFPFARALAGAVSDDVEIFIRNEGRPEGTRVRVSARPWLDSEGNVIGAIALLREMAGRRSTGMLERLWSVVEHTTDAVVMTDLEGTIVYVNPAFEQITGYSSREAIGATPRILKSGMHDRQFYDAMWSAVSAGSVFRGVLINRRKDGEHFYAEQTITPVTRPDGTRSHYVSVLRDITERRRLVERETEVRLARDVQLRLYPAVPPLVPGYDIAGAVYPADVMCGDYFDVFPMTEGATGIVIADVSGHNMGAALIMAQARAYVRALASTHGDVNAVLAGVNDALVRDLAAEHFLTMVVARFDPCRRAFTYASGGHHDGFVLDARGNVREILSSNGMALGFFPGRTYEPRPSVALRPGEMLLLFTDGIIESESPDGEQFGNDRAVAAAAASRHLTAAAITRNLYLAARSFAAGAPQVDDMTVFVCKSIGGPDCPDDL